MHACSAHIATDLRWQGLLEGSHDLSKLLVRDRLLVDGLASAAERGRSEGRDVQDLPDRATRAAIHTAKEQDLQVALADPVDHPWHVWCHETVRVP